MRTDTIPTALAFTVSLILASHGFTVLTAPQTLVNLAVRQAQAAVPV
jgi:hypothetical protein